MQKLIGCFGIMNAQARLRTNWLKRGEWNVLLLSAICALLLASPSAGASLAASPLAMSSLSSLSSAGTASQYEAVLWWLQHSAGGTSRYAHNLGARSHIASFVAATPVFDTPESNPLEAHEVASLLATLQSTDLAHTRDINLPRVAHKGVQQSKVTANHAAYTQSSLPPQWSSLAPRYDATRHLASLGLTAHEAISLSGTRTNSYLE